MDFKNMGDNLKNKISGTVDSMKNQYDEATDALKNSFSKFADLPGAAKEKMVEFVNSLIALSPVIEETGYRTQELKIGVAIPPKVVFKFTKIKDISPEEVREILEKHKDMKMLAVVVNTLITADNFQKKLQLGSLKFKEIELELGLPPSVDIVLFHSKKKDGNEVVEVSLPSVDSPALSKS